MAPATQATNANANANMACHGFQKFFANDWKSLEKFVKDRIPYPTTEYKLVLEQENGEWKVDIHFTMEPYEYQLICWKSKDPATMRVVPDVDAVLARIYVPYIAMMAPITDTASHNAVLQSLIKGFGVVSFINMLRKYLEDLQLASTIDARVYRQYKKDINTLLGSLENRTEYTRWLYTKPQEAEASAPQVASAPAPQVASASAPAPNIEGIPKPAHAPEGVSLRRFGFYMRAKGDQRTEALTNAVNYYGKPEVLEKLAFLIHIYDKKRYYQAPMIADYRYIQENL